jgi:hypothetical protein
VTDEMGERRRRPWDDRQRGPGALLKSCRATQTQDERRPAPSSCHGTNRCLQRQCESHDRRHYKLACTEHTQWLAHHSHVCLLDL